MFAYKTKNNNWMIPDRMNQRFIDSNGKHIRWISEQEASYLMRVLECHEIDDSPKPISIPNVPEEKIIWQYVEPAEFPELSNNGGSYEYLYRIVLRSGWDNENLNGYVLVTNHLYNSDFEDQGWNESPIDNWMEYIEKFNIKEIA